MQNNEEQSWAPAYPRHLPAGKQLFQEGPWYPGNKKGTTSQQCTLVAKKEDSCQQVEGSDPAPMLSAGEAASGMLHLIQGLLAQERSGLNWSKSSTRPQR